MIVDEAQDLQIKFYELVKQILIHLRDAPKHAPKQLVLLGDPFQRINGSVLYNLYVVSYRLCLVSCLWFID